MSPGPLLMGVALAAAAITRRRRLSLGARAVAGLGVTGLLIAGGGLVAMPSVDEMVREATGVLGDLTYVVVGAFAFAESGALVGLVAPGELIVVLGGVTAGHSTIALVPLIAVVWASALSGDLVSYTLGRRFGRGLLLRHGAGFGVTAARLDRVEGFLADHGAKTILLGRFIGLVRALAPFVAGASRMPARRFVPLAVLASGIWAAAFASLGYAFWESLDTLVTVVERAGVALAVLAAAAVLVSRLSPGRLRRPQMGARPHGRDASAPRSSVMSPDSPKGTR